MNVTKAVNDAFEAQKRPFVFGDVEGSEDPSESTLDQLLVQIVLENLLRMSHFTLEHVICLICPYIAPP